jgi:hypothetical protein
MEKVSKFTKIFSNVMYVYIRKHLLCFTQFLGAPVWIVSRDSSVGIATGYGLEVPGIESRWGFSAPVQTGPGAHPASCTMGTVSFPWVKSGRDVTLTPRPLLVPWS